MRTLDFSETAEVSGGGDPVKTGTQVAVGVAGTFTPCVIAGSAGVTGGTCTGVAAGGVVTGAGVVTVALPAAVAAGSFTLGCGIRNGLGWNEPIEKFGDVLGVFGYKVGCAASEAWEDLWK